MARTKTSVKPGKPPLAQAIQTPKLIPTVIKVLSGIPNEKNDAQVVVAPRVRKNPERASLTAPFSSAPKSDMGTMRVLPLEVLHMVCLSLDLRSCFKLRQVNRQARCIVSGLPQYHDLTNYALECLKVVFLSRAARMVTVDDLHTVFCSPECKMCSGDAYRSRSSQTVSQSIGSGNNDVQSPDATTVRGGNGKKLHCSQPGKTKNAAKETAPAPTNDAAVTVDQLQLQLISNTTDKTDGMFLFLPTLTRCCRACLEESPRVRTGPLCALVLASGLAAKDFESVRIAAPLMKIKNPAKMSDKQRMLLTGTVSQQDAVRVLLEKGKTPSDVKAHLYQSGYISEFSWSVDLYRSAAFTTIMPFMDRRARQAYRGFVCKGCDQAAQAVYGRFKAKLRYFQPVYGTRTSFLDHVSNCRDALLLWGEHNATTSAA